MEHVKRIASKYGISIIFILCISISPIVLLISKDKQTSTQENRPLQQQPEFSTSALVSGRYQSDVESYMSDQFPARSTWVKLRTNLEHAIGKDEFNGVYIGENNELFQESVKPSKKMMKEKIDSINQFASSHQDIPMSMLLIPNKATILEDKLPSVAQNQNQEAVMTTFQKGLVPQVNYINVNDVLKQHKKEYIYYRNDHHWTSQAAYMVFQTWKSIMLPQEPLLQYEHHKVNDSFYGTLANTSAYYRGKADEISIYLSKDDPKYYVQYASKKKTTTTLYDSAKLDTSNPYEVFLSGNEALIDIHTTADNTKHLLVIKDSYANSFVPFLLPYYSTITIVDPRYYYEDFDALIKDRSISETLFLYNANTFFSDSSLQSMLITQ